MGLFSGILQNKAIQNAAFGQLRGLIVQHKLDFILVKLDDTGDIAIQLHRTGETTLSPNPDFIEPLKNDDADKS